MADATPLDFGDTVAVTRELERRGVSPSDAAWGASLLQDLAAEAERRGEAAEDAQATLETAAEFVVASSASASGFSAQLDRGLVGVMRAHTNADALLDAAVWINSFRSHGLVHTVEHWITKADDPYPLSMDGTNNKMQLSRRELLPPPFNARLQEYDADPELRTLVAPMHFRIQICLHDGELPAPDFVSSFNSPASDRLPVTVTPGAFKFLNKAPTPSVVAVLQVNPWRDESGTIKLGKFVEMWLVPRGQRPPLAGPVDVVWLDGTERAWGAFKGVHGALIGTSYDSFTGVGEGVRLADIDVTAEKTPVPRQTCD